MSGSQPHAEVLAALQLVAPEDPNVGERIRVDRGSALHHLGVRTPVRRRLVKQGFSFTDGADDQVLNSWNVLWNTSSCADVMFTPLDYYRERLRAAIPPNFWETTQTWIARIDNWAHADDLARVYSWVLAADRDNVYPQLQAWNRMPGLWERRISIVSLVHYAGKNSFFMPVEAVLPLLENCLDDDRPLVQKAVGWVLRETSDAYPDDTVAFLSAHLDAVQPATLRRATHRFTPAMRDALR